MSYRVDHGRTYHNCRGRRNTSDRGRPSWLATYDRWRTDLIDPLGADGIAREEDCTSHRLKPHGVRTS